MFKKKYMKYFVKSSCVIFIFIWLLVASSFVLSNKPTDFSTSSVGYFPQSVRIPNSIYRLSELIANHNLNIPVIPTEIIDPYLKVLSVRVSRLRSSGSATFIITKQQEILNLNFWCLFDDHSITPAYTFNVQKSKNSIFFYECSLPDSIIQRLWYNRTIDQEIKIYLSTSRKILFQGFLDIPWSNWAEENEQSLTLCTLLLYNDLTYFTQWIEYHRLVGISKFVVYNISNTNNQYYSTINLYEEEYPSLIDIIQWDDSIDEIQYDCFLRYGDISEWITVININEYLIPQNPYDTLPRLLTEQYGRNLQASVMLENQEFCSNTQYQFTKNEIIIEHYILRHTISNHSVKYLYQPRAIDYLSIHRDSIETMSDDQIKKTIALAQYPTISHDKPFSNCVLDKSIVDTTIRDRFAKHLFDEIVKR
ncbi:unnamed protein product [Rotaria sp. Silwood1]|nr:unnamed protein product [Rotaria sp. Silwood1]CAF3624734.1 unnamed protein product [Rotaria sp. Silwood1]CAF4642196.1 unnamed protein product [Rotaria sp. Silwood1]